MGINMHLMNSIAKQKAAFFGHICRGSSGNDVTDWLNTADYGSLKRISENRTAWKVLIDNVWLP